MAVIVVDVLEIVDVEKGEREAFSVAVARQQAVGAMLDHAPRGQAGQLVEIGRAEQLVLEVLLPVISEEAEIRSSRPARRTGRCVGQQHLARGAVSEVLLR